MAYRAASRTQLELFPASIEEYVAEEDPVRAYDAFVEALDLEALGIRINPDQVGNPAYDPTAMTKLLVYGYSYGWRSSRKLERATYHNVSFMWLLGGLKPDHKTIARFRRDNQEALKGILKQCAQLCIRLELIEGNTLFVDGTKIRANANIQKSWDQRRCQKAFQKIDQRIEAILRECDLVDAEEVASGSLVKMNEELKDQQVLRKKVQAIMSELQSAGKKSINTTDSDCTRFSSLQGSHAGYNVQSVVDAKAGLIVHTDVVDENNDMGQFAKQVDQANEVLGKPCQTACADCGYGNVDELEKIQRQEIKVIVPSIAEASDKKKEKPFDKRNFPYDAQKDCYFCPAGHELELKRITPKSQESFAKEYEIVDKRTCLECPHFGVCTTSKKGRRISRLLHEDARDFFDQQYRQPESQAVYGLRKEKVELPFGHIKRNLGVGSFLLRGRQGARAEISILATCFNLSRLITIFGVSTLIAKLSA